MLEFRTFTTLEDCKNLWQEFSPLEYLYDDWGFRYLFNRYRGYQMEFIVGYIDNLPIGLLPLQIHLQTATDNPTKPPIHREFFGGYYMNRNRIYFKQGAVEQYRQYTADFYAQVPKPYRLEYFIDDNKYLPEAIFLENEYLLNLEGINDAEDYLEKHWQGKSKRKMKKFLRHVELLNPQISFGGKEDLDTLFKLNIERFGTESSYQSDIRKEIIKEFFDLGLKVEILKVEIANEVKAISLAFFYNNVYYCLSSGIDLSVQDIAKYFNIAKIQRGIDLKARQINFLTGDYGYKHRWFPDLVPTYGLISD